MVNPKNTRRMFAAIALWTVSIGIAVMPCFGKNKPKRETVTTTLQQVQEIRRAKLVSHKSDTPAFDFNPPGIELKFSITPPQGKTIVRLEQPTAINATDSTGFDLTKIKPNFMGREAFLTLIQGRNESPAEFTLTLTPARRSAQNFSVSADFDIWAFDETKEIDVTPGGKTQSLNRTVFGGQQVTARLEKTKGGVQLVIVPGSVKEQIESVKLLSGDTEYSSRGSMWNDAVATYMFDGTFADSLTARLVIRTGLEKFPCHLNVKDRALP